jgi:hypothetical protein
MELNGLVAPVAPCPLSGVPAEGNIVWTSQLSYYLLPKRKQFYEVRKDAVDLTYPFEVGYSRYERRLLPAPGADPCRCHSSVYL